MLKPSPKNPEVIELTSLEFEALLGRLENCNLSDSDKRLFKGALRSYIWLKDKYQSGKLGLHKLASLLFGSKSEKRSKPDKGKGPANEATCGSPPDEAAIPEAPIDPGSLLSPQDSATFASPPQHEQNLEEKKPQGHGRLGSVAYPHAENITLNHPTLKPGNLCPQGCVGKLYSIEPGVVIRVVGQDLAKAIRYHIQKLRCSACGLIVKASLPPEASEGKYDYRFKAILAVQKYFVGVPFYRQEDFQELMNFPLPDSTQWELAEQLADSIHPIFTALEKQAARAKIVYNDDTPVKIIEIMQLNKKDPARKRKGMFTTGIYAQLDDGTMIALYYSGARHAGENLALILKHRPKDLKPVIHMSDALSANLTEFLVLRGICIAHGRRKFIEIEAFFPEECRFVIDQFATVYYNDSQAKKAGLSGRERLAYHKEHSRPAMKALKAWLDRQARQNLVEPNSGLGQAIGYLRRHWEGLTLFLRQADAPLDNNILEQALKIPIRLRKNSLVHRTCHGAKVAGILMSIIQTCRLRKVNPIDYLTILQANKSAVFKNPDDWQPWRYEETLKRQAVTPLAA